MPKETKTTIIPSVPYERASTESVGEGRFKIYSELVLTCGCIKKTGESFEVIQARYDKDWNGLHYMCEKHSKEVL